VFLLYYTRSQAGMESQTLHVMEIGSAVLLVCGVVVIPCRHGAAERDGNGGDESPCGDQNGTRRPENNRDAVEQSGEHWVSETTAGRMLGLGTIVVIGTGRHPAAFTRSRIH